MLINSQTSPVFILLKGKKNCNDCYGLGGVRLIVQGITKAGFCHCVKRMALRIAEKHNYFFWKIELIDEYIDLTVIKEGSNNIPRISGAV